MDTFKQRLGRDMLVFDGAMGTMLQQAGLLGTGAPEALNIIEPDSIERIHNYYVLAGTDCITTNTFGANRNKLAHYNNSDLCDQINAQAVKLARRSGAPYVLAGIGPTGLILESVGGGTTNSDTINSNGADSDDGQNTRTSFDDIYDVFLQQARALAAGKPDAFLLETFTDIAELRCAVIACRDADDSLPIVASLSFGVGGRMELSGTDPQSAAVILEGLRVDAIGLNCGLGPQQLEPLAMQMRAATHLPIIVQPNAGMPRLDPNGETYFPGKPEDFAIFAQNMHAAGIAAIGSCCGSGPEFTATIADEISDAKCVQTNNQSTKGLRIASPQRTLNIGGSGVGDDAPLRMIGERINPTGKPELKTQLQDGSMTLVRSLAAQQQAAGADILDINVGVAGIDEVRILKAAVLAVTTSLPLPIAIDTTNPEALEAALKAYPGKALVNSVTGEQRSLDAVLPLVARYGAAVVVLALDDDGIPDTAQGRLDIVRCVQKAAHEYGIADDDLLVDSLVMAAAADKDAPGATLETVRLVQNKLGLATVLGVSNVSHGLPNRSLLNAAFLTTAADAGLSAAIVNPNERVTADAVAVINAARENSLDSSLRLDNGSVVAHLESKLEQLDSRQLDSAQSNAEFQQAFADFKQLLDAAFEPQLMLQQGSEDDTSRELSIEAQLANAIVLGDSDGAPQLMDFLIKDGVSAGDIIENILTPTIQNMGKGFATGEVFLPQLMVAADAMKVAVDQARTYLMQPRTGTGYADDNKIVVFATVQGDIHSIGKDICVSLLESQGVSVKNLGVDVSVKRILEAADDADVVCLSALMTTTLPAMADSVRALRNTYPDLSILLGGAVVTKEWADSQGACYEADAPALAARIVDLLNSND